MTSENLVLGYKIEFPFLFIRKIDTFSIILLTFCLFVVFFLLFTWIGSWGWAYFPSRINQQDCYHITFTLNMNYCTTSVSHI